MHQSDSQYTKLRWVLTIIGLILYVGDILTDIRLSVKYFQEEHYLWTGLTLVFILTGLLVTQIFSYVWYRDDMNAARQSAEDVTTISGLSKGGLASLHVVGMGIFTRYFQLLKEAFTVVWKSSNSYTAEQKKDLHYNLFCLATDLSMLKLFESFLESAPQLLLQLYIILRHGECSVLQYLSMVFSFFNLSWALVDYRRCLRRSLPHIREMPSGLPTTIYLLYKLCTITSHILSYALLLMLSAYTTIGLTFVWLVGMTWGHLLKTNFCTNMGLEFLYRAVIGFILMFTFFNVIGQNTKIPMGIYYLFYSAINIATLLLLAFLNPDLLTPSILLTISGLIFGCLVLGLVCLTLYYLLLHPRETCRQADEVDGLKEETEPAKRMRNFLQP